MFFSFKLNLLAEVKMTFFFLLVLHFLFTASSSISQLFKLMIATELKKKKEKEGLEALQKPGIIILKTGSQQQEPLKASAQLHSDFLTLVEENTDGKPKCIISVNQ